MVICLRSSVYVMEVENWWKDTEKESIKLKKENELLRSIVSDEGWLQEVESKVRKSKFTEKNIIYNEIGNRLSEEDQHLQGKGQNVTNDNLLATSIEKVEGDKDGRVI